MKKIVSVVAALGLVACAQTQKVADNVKQAAIDCAKEEASTATKGQDTLLLAIQIIEAFQQAVLDGDYLAVVERLGVQYGEPFVACVVKDAFPTLSKDDPFAAAAKDTIAKRGWLFK